LARQSVPFFFWANAGDVVEATIKISSSPLKIFANRIERGVLNIGFRAMKVNKEDKWEDWAVAIACIGQSGPRL